MATPQYYTRLHVQSTSQQHPLHATTEAAVTKEVPSQICARRPTFQSNAAHLHGHILPVPSSLPVLQMLSDPKQEHDALPLVAPQGRSKIHSTHSTPASKSLNKATGTKRYEAKHETTDASSMLHAKLNTPTPLLLHMRTKVAKTSQFLPTKPLHPMLMHTIQVQRPVNRAEGLLQVQQRRQRQTSCRAIAMATTCLLCM
jgi:hypothetical protein